MGLRKLIRKRIDLITSGKMHFLHLLNRKYPEWIGQLEIVKLPLKTNNFDNAISKNI